MKTGHLRPCMIDLLTGSRRLSFAANVFLAIIVVLLVVPMALMALALGFGLSPLPTPLFVVLQRLPFLFPVHMIASALALIIIPIAAFARRRGVFHRAAGWLAAACVVVGST